uniref:Uncharacterized protein n=1 Tax=Arundo donax TaxID=35708 RepID=A0A0A9C376_ARUDO
MRPRYPSTPHLSLYCSIPLLMHSARR